MANKLMTAQAFAAKARAIATEYKTSYMLGPWGWPATEKMIQRACSGSRAVDNKTWSSYAEAIRDEGFLFDCVGLIKGILWGWSGDLSRTYGGAGYACNGVPDYDAGQMIAHCEGVSGVFGGIETGEVVYMPGHIGIYVGGGVVAESTPRWKWGVQLSTCANVNGRQITGTVGSRAWTKHGKLPWVDYETKEKEADMTYYKTLNEVPSWYRSAIEKLMKDGSLSGTGNGELNVSEDFCRVMTVLDRRGKL